MALKINNYYRQSESRSFSLAALFYKSLNPVHGLALLALMS